MPSRRMGRAAKKSDTNSNKLLITRQLHVQRHFPRRRAFVRRAVLHRREKLVAVHLLADGEVLSQQ